MPGHTATPRRPIDVLLVEDSPSDAELTRKAFQRQRIDLRLHHVWDGVECLDFLERAEPFREPPRDVVRGSAVSGVKCIVTFDSAVEPRQTDDGHPDHFDIRHAAVPGHGGNPGANRVLCEDLLAAPGGEWEVVVRVKHDLDVGLNPPLRSYMFPLIAAEIQPDGCAEDAVTHPAEDHLLEVIPVPQIDDVILRLEAQLGQRYTQRCEVGDQRVLSEVVLLRAYKIGDWLEVVLLAVIRAELRLKVSHHRGRRRR